MPISRMADAACGRIRPISNHQNQPETTGHWQRIAIGTDVETTHPSKGFARREALNRCEQVELVSGTDLSRDNLGCHLTSQLATTELLSRVVHQVVRDSEWLASHCTFHLRKFACQWGPVARPISSKLRPPIRSRSSLLIPARR
jgi:hypothetical protein